jgi:hypothetical protein
MKFNYNSKLKIQHKIIYRSSKGRSVDINLLKVKKLAKSLGSVDISLCMLILQTTIFSVILKLLYFTHRWHSGRTDLQENTASGLRHKNLSVPSGGRINLTQVFVIFLIGKRSFSWFAGLATRYGIGGPRIESRWRRDFPKRSRPALVSTQPPIQLVPSLSRG